MTAGRLLRNSITGLLFTAALLCMTTPAMAAPDQPILVLVSSEEAVYSSPINSFIAALDLPIKVVNLRGELEQAPGLMTGVMAQAPRLIFALGAKAAVVSKVWTASTKTPVIFAMVLNWERYQLLDSENMAGIDYNIAPGTQLANLMMLAPSNRRVGIIYSRDHSSLLVAEARESAARLGLEIIDSPIENPHEFQRAFKKIEDRIDSYLILPDPVVYTLENISWLEKRCLADRIICQGPSENVTGLGIVLSVNPDPGSIGTQAASMARSVLENNILPATLGVMPPIGTQMFINLKSARQIGLEISQNILDQASEVISP